MIAMTETARKSRLSRTCTLVLIALVLLIGGGVLMVWLPYHREQQVITEVEKLGGSTYSKIVRPIWVTDGVGDEHLWLLKRSYAIDFSNTQVNDADLEHFRGLTDLEWLRINKTRIGDAGLRHLRGLTNLKNLSLNDTLVTNAGVRHLRGLSNLEEVSLINTQIDDAGLEHLKQFNNLKELILNDTQATRAGIEELRVALPNCEIHSDYVELPW